MKKFIFCFSILTLFASSSASAQSDTERYRQENQAVLSWLSLVMQCPVSRISLISVYSDRALAIGCNKDGTYHFSDPRFPYYYLPRNRVIMSRGSGRPARNIPEYSPAYTPNVRGDRLQLQSSSQEIRYRRDHVAVGIGTFLLVAGHIAGTAASAFFSGLTLSADGIAVGWIPFAGPIIASIGTNDGGAQATLISLAITQVIGVISLIGGMAAKIPVYPDGSIRF